MKNVYKQLTVSRVGSVLWSVLCRYKLCEKTIAYEQNDLMDHNFNYPDCSAQSAQTQKIEVGLYLHT